MQHPNVEFSRNRGACASAMFSGEPKPLRTISDPVAANARAMPGPIPVAEEIA